MANVYVRSGAAGAGTGADWANAYTTLSAALTAKAAGDDFWVSEDHAESTAGALAFTAPGTAASPNRIVCVDHAGTVPPVSADLRTTATVSTSGNNNITGFAGVAYCYGVTFNAGSGAVTASLTVGNSAALAWDFDSCAFAKRGTSATGAGAITFGTSSSARQRVRLKNTTLSFGNAQDSLTWRSVDFEWRETSAAIAGATLPTTLVQGSSPFACCARMVGVDLSALGSGKTLLASIAAPQKVEFIDCAFGASLTVAAASAAQGGGEATVIRADSSGTNYRHERYAYEGTQTVETTIVRTGGAKMGSQSFAWKLVTTANSKFYMPLGSLPIEMWNLFTGQNLTVDLYGIWGGAAVPNNDDIWMEIAYLGAAGTPLASVKSTSKADVLATAAAVASDSSAWGGSTTAFKLTATLSAPQPTQAGSLRIIVKAAKASTTFYIDPKPAIQGVAVGRQSLVGHSLVSEIPGRSRLLGGLAA